MMTDYIKKITLTAVVTAFCLVTSSFAADTEKSTQEAAVVNTEKREPVAYRLRLRELTLNRKAYKNVPNPKVFLLSPGEKLPPKPSKGDFFKECFFPMWYYENQLEFLIVPKLSRKMLRWYPDAKDQFQVLYDGSKFKDIPVKDGALAVACFDIDIDTVSGIYNCDPIFTITIYSEDLMKKDENGKIRLYIDSNGMRALDVNESNRKKIENKEYHEILFSVEEIYITEKEDTVKISNKD